LAYRLENGLCFNAAGIKKINPEDGDGVRIPDEAAAQDPQQPCSAPLGCQSSASGKQRHPRRPRLVRDHRHKSAMCHPPGLPPPPSQGRTPSVPGLRSHAPGRQRVVSPIPISHRRGDPARGEPAGVRCPRPPQSGLASTDATESAPQRQRHACAWRLEGLPVSTAPRPRESRMHAALRWLDLAVR